VTTDSWPQGAGAVVAAGLLPACLGLAKGILGSADRVVANNARCMQLVSRISAMKPLLQDLHNKLDARCVDATVCWHDLQNKLAARCVGVTIYYLIRWMTAWVVGNQPTHLVFFAGFLRISASGYQMALVITTSRRFVCQLLLETQSCT
jgi:hypothetical protein